MIIDADWNTRPSQFRSAGGSRSAPRRIRLALSRRWTARHVVGSKMRQRLISVVFNTFFRQATTDLYTGMKALRRDALDSLTLHRDGFEHVAEMGVQLAQAGHHIYEIPVKYAPRASGVSKMRHLRETVNYVWYVVTAWLRFRVARRT